MSRIALVISGAAPGDAGQGGREAVSRLVALRIAFSIVHSTAALLSPH